MADVVGPGNVDQSLAGLAPRSGFLALMVCQLRQRTGTTGAPLQLAASAGWANWRWLVSRERRSETTAPAVVVLRRLADASEAIDIYAF
jgi:hypothetical protein